MFAHMKIKTFIIITVLTAAIFAGCATKTDGGGNDAIPEMFIVTESCAWAELVRFSYTWRLGDLSAEEIQEVHADTVAPFDYTGYSPTNAVTVTDQARITLSTNKERIEKGYIRALGYTIWKPDGTVYDDGSRQPYDSQSLRMTVDDGGNVVLTAPFVKGEYIWAVEVEFERGRVTYVFKVIVSFVTVPEAEELLTRRYPSASEIRHMGQQDIVLANLHTAADAYVFEVDIAEETALCAVSTSGGLFYFFHNGQWLALNMTLDDVARLAAKGDGLLFEDFKQYYKPNLSSAVGYNVIVYVINGGYRLVVRSKDSGKPDSVTLESVWDSGGSGIDIRYDDLAAFLLANPSQDVISEGEALEICRRLTGKELDPVSWYILGEFTGELEGDAAFARVLLDSVNALDEPCWVLRVKDTPEWGGQYYAVGKKTGGVYVCGFTETGTLVWESFTGLG